MKSLPVRLFGVSVSLVLILVFGLVFFAVGRASADSITRSFNAKETISAGQVVALSFADKSTVELAPANDPTRIFGVAVDQKTASMTVSQPGQEVFVATGGIYQVLVSTENGPIHSGDYLSMSSLDGIAAKITSGQVFIIGRALQDFDGSNVSAVKDKNGSAQDKISAQITPGKNPSLREDTTVPTPLRRLAEAIANKPLSAGRIYAALVIFIMSATITFGLLWVGVRSGMIAIGRNPLSRHSIMQSLAQVIVASAIVFMGGLFGIYLVLRI